MECAPTPLAILVSEEQPRLSGCVLSIGTCSFIVHTNTDVLFVVMLCFALLAAVSLSSLLFKSLPMFPLI